MLRRQLKRRFAEVPQWADEKLTSADAEQLEEWAEELVVSDSLDDMFAMTGGSGTNTGPPPQYVVCK